MSVKPFRHFDYTFEQPHLDLKFRVSSVKCKCMSCEDLRLEAWEEGKMVLSKEWYLHPMDESNMEANIIQAMVERIQELEDIIANLTEQKARDLKAREDGRGKQTAEEVRERLFGDSPTTPMECSLDPLLDSKVK